MYYLSFAHMFFPYLCRYTGLTFAKWMITISIGLLVGEQLHLLLSANIQSSLSDEHN